jgi:hypothetical protein
MPIINLDVLLIRFASDYPSISSPAVTSYIACFLAGSSQITCKCSGSSVTRTDSAIMNARTHTHTESARP